MQGMPILDECKLQIVLIFRESFWISDLVRLVDSTWTMPYMPSFRTVTIKRTRSI